MHKILITNREHYRQSSAMLLIRFPCQLFLGWNIREMTMYGVQQMFLNQGLGYTSVLPAFKFCIEWQGHSRTRYVLLFVEHVRGYLTSIKCLTLIICVLTGRRMHGQMGISVESSKWTTWKLFWISITQTEKLESLIVSSCLTTICTVKWQNITRINAKRLLIHTLVITLMTTHMDMSQLTLDLAQT